MSHVLLVVVKLDHMTPFVFSNVACIFIDAYGLSKMTQLKHWK